MPYSRSAVLYDMLYSFKDYPAEVARLREVIARHKRTPGMTLLDVACGTAKHTAFLAADFQVEGLDIEGGMLEVARRLPHIPFHQADMANFALDRQFDVITCLFSSIGHMRTPDRLFAAVACMARHLLPGGVLVVEPWIEPEKFIGGTPHALFVDQPDLKLARMNVSYVIDGTISVLDFHYVSNQPKIRHKLCATPCRRLAQFVSADSLVATPAGVEYFTERHELGLFPPRLYAEAFAAAGLQTTHDPVGLDRRGLYIGVR